MFRCLCGEHYTYRTVKAVNDDPRALMCPHVECLACGCSPYLACSCTNNAYESPDAKADALWCVILQSLAFATAGKFWTVQADPALIYSHFHKFDSAEAATQAVLHRHPWRRTATTS